MQSASISAVHDASTFNIRLMSAIRELREWERRSGGVTLASGGRSSDPSASDDPVKPPVPETPGGPTQPMPEPTVVPNPSPGAPTPSTPHEPMRVPPEPEHTPVEGP